MTRTLRVVVLGSTLQTWYLRLVVICLVALPCNAAARDDAAGIWLVGSVTGPVSEDESTRWLFGFDAQARYVDAGTGINTWLLRPAVGYTLGERTRAWIGYAHFRVRNRAGDLADEDRIWQQLDWKTGVWGNGDLSLRLRLEQRFNSLGSDTRHVGRLRAKYVRPFGNTGRRSLVLAAESFFDLGSSDRGGDAGISQGRLAAGLAWKTGPKTSLEVGYMYQHVFVEDLPDRANHIAILRFQVDLR